MSVYAGMAELVYAVDLKSIVLCDMQVRLLLPVLESLFSVSSNLTLRIALRLKVENLIYYARVSQLAEDVDLESIQ